MRATTLTCLVLGGLLTAATWQYSTWQKREPIKLMNRRAPFAPEAAEPPERTLAPAMPDLPVTDRNDTQAPSGLAVDKDGHLIVNRALRDVLDYFFLSGLPGDASRHKQRLLAHLRASLPPAAYREAARIADTYRQYLDALEMQEKRWSILASDAQNAMPAIDIDRAISILTQRKRLRQTMLGIDIDRLWFADEEAEEERKLAALRDGNGNAPETDSFLQREMSTLNSMQMRGASSAAQRLEIESTFGPEAARRFDDFENKEAAWQEHYAAYRAAADELARQSENDPARQEHDTEALREKMFKSDSERMRARALDLIANSAPEK